MSTHRETRTVHVPRAHLYAIVASVEDYPKFLPMWRSVNRTSEDANSYITDQEVALGPLHQRFLTKTWLQPPDLIEITSDDAVFRRFLIRWRFVDAGPTTRVTVDLEWAMRSRALQRAIDLALPYTARVMVRSFEKRALEGAE